MPEEKSIVKMNAPLTYSAHLTNLPEQSILAIADAFPDDSLDTEQRRRKAMTYLSQAKLYIETAQSRDKILACVSESIAECVMSLASMDLPLIKSLGFAALIPYSNVCTISIMYQGLVELIMRSGTVASIQAGVVYEGQEFDYELGSEPWLKCKMFDGNRSDDKLTHAWAIAHNLNGPKSIEVMDRAELDKVRAASNQKSGVIYKNWFAEMCRKAPTRRLAKYMRKAVGGVPQLVLERALDIENAQFDLGKLDHYKGVRQAHSDDLKARAHASLTEPTLPAPALTEDGHPIPDNI